jgi:uncharacterized protein
MKYGIIVFIILLSTVAFALPEPVGFVNDFANVLTDKVMLEETLNAYEKNTTIEIAVVTIETLPEDQTAATYAVELFDQWNIGKKGEDNGILVLVIVNGTTGNRLRIELGYGIQGYITGAEAGRILDDALPYYEQGDYETTVEIILAELSDKLVDYVPGKEATVPIDVYLVDFLPFIFMFFVVIMSIASAHYSEKCPNCGSKKIEYEKDGEYCTCKKCGKRFKCKKKRSGFVPIFLGGFSGGGGGFGGFGGGGSGGGGAGR